MIVISKAWIGIFLALAAVILPLASFAAERIVVLEHYTNFR